MKISGEANTKNKFVCEGVKLHKLMQAGEAILLITEKPSELSYIIDFFDWQATVRSIISEEKLKLIVLSLGNQDEIIINYDEHKIYQPKQTVTSVSQVISGDIQNVYKYGFIDENDSF